MYILNVRVRVYKRQTDERWYDRGKYSPYNNIVETTRITEEPERVDVDIFLFSSFSSHIFFFSFFFSFLFSFLFILPLLSRFTPYLPSFSPSTVPFPIPAVLIFLASRCLVSRTNRALEYILFIIDGRI